MSLQTRLEALASAVGTDVKAIKAENISRNPKIIVLNAADAVPAGTEAGTIILRRP